MRLVERSQSLVNGVSSIRVKQGLFFDFFLSLDLGMEGLARSRASIWPRKWGHAKMGSENGVRVQENGVRENGVRVQILTKSAAFLAFQHRWRRSPQSHKTIDWWAVLRGHGVMTLGRTSDSIGRHCREAGGYGITGRSTS